MKRSSGILMPVFSLPSPYGIGTFGKAAKDFVDFLNAGGQSWWQMLPLGPTSYGDSPYQSHSTFAGNPYFIDPDLLREEGLLTKEEIDSFNWGSDPLRVDYGLLYQNRFSLLRMAFERGRERNFEERRAFFENNSAWLPDYALYMALKNYFDMKPWLDWPDEEIRLHRQSAVEKYSKLLKEDINFHIYTQFLFFKQWDALREYACGKGIGFIGDLPIYVALDSADVWAEPEMFQLDSNNLPLEVSGVPPDYFNEEGQLWGNPLYNYERMAEDGYSWWIRRIGGAKKLYDVIRIDHFRGFESYWAVPYSSSSAKPGRWVKGPGMRLIGVIRDWFKGLQFIAEDLGYPTPEVKQLLKDSGFPGMSVLEFAFAGGEENSFLPHHLERHSVCYIGTHDNAPVMGWKESGAAPQELDKAIAYLGISSEEGFARGMLRGGMSSVSKLFVAQMQDWLGLGSESRINTPGTFGDNWIWRVRPEDFTNELSGEIFRITELYGRLWQQQK